MNRHHKRNLIPLTLALTLACANARATDSPAVLDQHAINEYAAAFLRIRLSLVDALGVRLPDERPEAYFARLLTESHDSYAVAEARAKDYLKPIAAAVKATAPIRAGLKSKDVGAENVALFKRASRDAVALNKLYMRALALQSSANAIHSPSAADEKVLSLMQRRVTQASLFAQILHVAQDGYNVLRDARP